MRPFSPSPEIFPNETVDGVDLVGGHAKLEYTTGQCVAFTQATSTNADTETRPVEKDFDNTRLATQYVEKWLSSDEEHTRMKSLGWEVRREAAGAPL